MSNDKTKKEFDKLIPKDEQLKPIQPTTTSIPIVYTGLSDLQMRFINLMIPMEFNITDICREVGINRSSYYQWLEENPAFNRAYEDTREYLVDKAEQVIIHSLTTMDSKTAQFVLKALNKKYKDKVDITSNGHTVGSVINILPPKKDDE